jgi:hypothetical protein
MARKIIPELEQYYEKHCCNLPDNPPYALIGSYTSIIANKLFYGVLLYTDNEFSAHFLKKQIEKSGYCTIETTEFHPETTTFCLEIYKEEIKKLMEKCKNG